MAIQRADVSTSIVHVFERQVEAHADRVVLDTPTERMTYRQLDEAANRVANQLLEQRGDASEPVPIAVADPASMLVAALGVLKAGKFYVPINPHLPVARIGVMMADLAPPITICDAVGRTAFDLSGFSRPRMLIGEMLAQAKSNSRPSVALDGDRPAYILYTSGSTGRPKGVLQIHRNVLHNIYRHNRLNIAPTDRVMLFSADGFVASVSNPYIAFLNGAALAPYSFRHLGIHSTLAWLRDAEVTCYYSFPSFFRQVHAAATERSCYEGLRLIYLGGETVFASDVKAARELFPAACICVGLNSTETGLTRLYVIDPGEEIQEGIVPVGGEVPDVDVRIVDDQGREVEDGVAGEVVVASPYIAPRYWEGSAADDPHAGNGKTSAIQAFRTGDRGQINNHGQLVHLGRVDSMVKVRGYRVELAEVESCLSSLDEVSEAVVMAYAPVPNECELVGYVVPAQRGLGGHALRGLLASVLPEAMVPSQIVFLDALPRTANGKVNRRELPLPESRATPANGQALAEAGSIEQKIAEIWRSVLATQEIHLEDNFFELGGHSLSAVRVITKLRQEFNLKLPLRVLFETPTIRALADEIVRLRHPSKVDKEVESK